MYTVYLDDNLIYHPNVPDLAILDSKLELELNSAGKFTLTLPADHPYYDSPLKMLSRVEVYRNDELLFRGRILDEAIDFYKRKTLTCEGELGYLNDSIQPPAEYHDMTLRSYLQTLIDEHNSQVDEDKQFVVGIVTVTDSNDSLYRYTNYNSTMTEIKEDLIDDYGGYLRVRYQDGVRYLDYVELTDYGATSDQAVRFGINLLDFTEDMDVTDIATVIIPLGAHLEESPIEALDMRLTIEDVNDGKDWIQSDEAVETYGRIVKTVTWDDVTVASNLLSKGREYLSDTQWDSIELTATAIDLNLTDTEIDAFSLGDQLRVVSAPHGLDRYFPLSKMTLDLANPSNNSYTLGLVTSVSLLGQLVTQTDVTTQLGDLSARISNRTAEAIANASSEILNEAKDAATILINAATHGYVVVEPDEILIMDTNDKDTAVRVWRWNLNGLGYSNTGYKGTYGLAMTMDGAIVADYITSGTMYADRIKGGTLTLGGSNNTYGSMSILNSSGSEVGSWNRNGITATAGTIGGWTITSSQIYGEYDDSGVTRRTAMQKPSSSITWVFAAGGDSSTGSYSAYPFRVSKAGAMYATSANITGTITSSSATITGGSIHMETSSNSYSAIYLEHTNDSYVEITSGWVKTGYVDGRAAQLFNYQLICPHIEGEDIYATDYFQSNGDGRVIGNFYCNGTKSRQVATDDYGDILQYCYETASPMFGDIGTGRTDSSGLCYIYFDEKFRETVSLLCEYVVFLQKEGEGDLWIAEKTGNYFVVKGTENLAFAWEVKARQKDYDNLRLETPEDEPEKEPNYDGMADYYLEAYERELMYE